jgi:hypothetical protein
VLLNPAGVDLGALDTSQGIGQLRRIDGNVAPFQRLVLSSLSITSAGILRTQVLQPTGVGILVQRVTGFHRFLGRRVPRLRLVGRVPFGPRRAGRARIRWSLRVNGRPLAPGTYLVTPRSVTAAGVVRETARPLVLRVPRRPVRGR